MCSGMEEFGLSTWPKCTAVPHACQPSIADFNNTNHVPTHRLAEALLYYMPLEAASSLVACMAELSPPGVYSYRYDTRHASLKGACTHAPQRPANHAHVNTCAHASAGSELIATCIDEDLLEASRSRMPQGHHFRGQCWHCSMSKVLSPV